MGSSTAPRFRAKAPAASACTTLEQIPNIGPSLAADLRSIGIERPAQLARQDAYQLYRALCERSGQRQDPCVLDTFLAAVDFMRGAAAAPWWHYTAERKRVYGQLGAHAAGRRHRSAPAG
ncbi:MAG TPA: helix-hairpin-helix domain-containing protein [Methylibium sp.]|nr:helix-hairpin-helix domain-containing protein [Methylibium sp.]